MILRALSGNSQRLDGGAMYGNAPRALWQRWSPPDSENRISLACRALLAEIEGKQVLFETGIGAFFEPEQKSRYGVLEEEHVLLRSLAEAGLAHEDIDVVVLSHLHFDHAGGLLAPYDGGPPKLLFPNATFLVGKRHYERARAPHARDRASFVPGMCALLEASGRLEWVEGERHPILGQQVRFHESDGHTVGLLLSELATKSGPLLFAADLIPGLPWVHLPITMGYDRFAEQLIEEKGKLLGDLLERGGHLFFTHDPTVPCATVTRDVRGRYVGVARDVTTL